MTDISFVLTFGKVFWAGFCLWRGGEGGGGEEEGGRGEGYHLETFWTSHCNVTVQLRDFYQIFVFKKRQCLCTSLAIFARKDAYERDWVTYGYIL